MKILIAQINTTIGDFENNLGKIINAIEFGKKNNVEIVVFPEMTITGYPPLDLLEKKMFVKKNIETLKKVVKYTNNIIVIVGFVEENKSPVGKPLFNSAAVIKNKKIVGIARKTLLPTYDVFDEARYFQPSSQISPIRIKNLNLGVTICEDIWNDKAVWKRLPYEVNPVLILGNKGIDVLINISSSPFTCGKEEKRLLIVKKIAKEFKIPVIYANLVGGNDSLVFDGQSFAVGKNGSIIKYGKAFEEEFIIFDLYEKHALKEFPPISDEEAIFKALCTGLRDYVHKCGFEKVAIGISGGIDSALVATIATYALGSKNVIGVAMPGPFSSKESLEDARILAKNLKIRLMEIPISEIFKTFLNSLSPYFKEIPADTTEENIQARIRGVLLMALSNKFGYLILNTGNKSELSVGYCTLYGDMVGGLSVTGDITKEMVYKLSNYVNKEREIIPERIIKKPPSAELRPDQKDEDSLPPYKILDSILKLYIEQNMDFVEISQKGFNKDVLKKVSKMIVQSEYKRRQAPPTLKVSPKAFGEGRRLPIAQHFVEDF